MPSIERKQYMKKMNIHEIINRHKRQPALVLAHGPSLEQVKNNLDLCKRNGIVTIGCNDWPNFYDIEPNYWVIASTVTTIERLHEGMNKKKVPILYADSVDLTDPKFVEAKLDCRYFPYDQRHTEWAPCTPRMPCCDRIDRSRFSLPEYVSKYTRYPELYLGTATVTVHMIAFAILFGCNPIFITGLHLKSKDGYAKNLKNLVPPEGDLDQYKEQIVETLEVLNKSAKNIGVRIINLYKNAEYDTFEKGELKF